MIHSAIVRIVDFCARNRWATVVAGTLLMLGAAAFDAARFSINTDIEGLISQDLPWRQRELELSKVFPKKGILVVVKATTPENAEQATNALAQALSKNPDLFPQWTNSTAAIFSNAMDCCSSLQPTLVKQQRD